jgi:hypothetical protein
MCITCNTTLRQSPGQKTHRYISYPECDRAYDHTLFVNGGRELLAEVYFSECEAALERRYKVAQQMQYYTLRMQKRRKPRKSRAAVPPTPRPAAPRGPPVKRRLLPAAPREAPAPVEVFTDEEADDKPPEEVLPALHPPPASRGPTPGQLRAQQWRAEAYAAFTK